MSHITLKGWHRYREKGNYSWQSSLIIAFVASILLWWLPVFGPMIAGYVSGRTAGTKFKGLFNTIIVSASIGLVSFIFSYLPIIPPGVRYYFSSVVLYHITLASPYGGWFASAIGQMFTSFSYFLVHFPSNWAVLIAFGFIGGSMSELLIKESGVKTVLPPKHSPAVNSKPMKPTEVEYQPEEKTHPLLKKIIKEKESQDSSDDYI
ncbi:MAG: hypothetical protein QW364_03815 [Thermoplasmatales archaeon]